jgi:ribosomal protein S14
MKSSKNKDLKLRKLFYKLEKKIKINKFLFINLLSKSKCLNLNKILRLQTLFSRISKVKLKTRCLLSNRGRAINSNYSISRLALKDLMQFGIVPGYKKSVW